MYTIYSVGDVQFLAKVFDGVSMLTGSGSLVGASAIACLLGVIFLCFQSVINTQGIKVQNILVCFVVYLVCFAVPTQVNIVSSQDDSNFAQRDNVPLGIAMIGSTISTITHELTDKMELAMSPVLTDSKVINARNGGGYANSLYLLNHVTRPQTGYVVDMVESLSPNFKANLTNYCAECTVIKYLLGGKKYPKDFSYLVTSDAMEAFKFDSKIYYTSLIDPETGETDDYTCEEGGNKLIAWWNDALKNMDEKQAKSLAKELLGYSAVTGDFSSYQEIVNKIQNATNQMALLGNKAANLGLPQASTAWVQKLIFANATREVVMRGVAQGYTSFADTNTSYMLTQAMLQRNSQWAAESSMFLNSVPAIMAFIEGFFYAITPFASILILLGLFGLNIFIKYIILLLWVQLWTPVMAIINMYIMHGASTDIFKIPAQLSGQDSSVSIYMNDSIAQITENWISVGSMFMAATPLLTFIILTGSAYALTSLTGRMNGADVINERMITPDIIQPGAGLAMSAVYNGNMNSTLMAGMENLLQKFSLSSSVSAAKSYSETDAINKGRTFANKFDVAVNEMGSKNQALASQALIDNAYSGKDNQIKTFGENMASSVMSEIGRSYNLSKEQTDMLTNKIKGNVGINTPLGGVGTEWSKDTAFMEKFGSNMSDAVKAAQQKAMDYRQSHAGEFAIAATNTLSKDASFGETFNKSTSAVDGFSESKQTAESAIRQASEIGQINEVMQTNGNYNAVDLISSLNNAGLQGQAQLQRLDQLYQEVYDNASDSERQMLDNCVNNVKSQHLTNDTATDERVGKLMALATSDLGDKGLDAGDVSRSVQAMQIATSALPGSHSSTLEGANSQIVSMATQGKYGVGVDETQLGADLGAGAALKNGVLQNNAEIQANTPGSAADVSATHEEWTKNGTNVGTTHLNSATQTATKAQSTVAQEQMNSSISEANNSPDNPILSLKVGRSEDKGTKLDPSVKSQKLGENEIVINGVCYHCDSANPQAMEWIKQAKAQQELYDNMSASNENLKNTSFDLLDDKTKKTIQETGSVYGKARTAQEVISVKDTLTNQLNNNEEIFKQFEKAYVNGISTGYSFNKPLTKDLELRQKDLDHIVKANNDGDNQLGSLVTDVAQYEYKTQQAFRDAWKYKDISALNDDNILKQIQTGATSLNLGANINQKVQKELNATLDDYSQKLSIVETQVKGANSNFNDKLAKIESTLRKHYKFTDDDQYKSTAYLLASSARIMGTTDYLKTNFANYEKARTTLNNTLKFIQKYKIVK